MTDYRSLNHTKWACQYYAVFIPKYRKKVIYTELRRYLGDVLRRLAQRRESEVEEGTVDSTCRCNSRGQCISRREVAQCLART